MRTKHAYIIVAFLLGNGLLAGQSKEDKQPYSNQTEETLKKASVVMAPYPAPPRHDLHTLDSLHQRSDYKRPYQVAYELAVDYNLENSGTWQTLKNGDRMWRLTIVSLQAKYIYLHYDGFHMPAGATLHVYNEDKKRILGPFTERNNQGSLGSPGVFATGYLSGDRLTLEYYEPAAQSGKGVLSVEKVFHVYEDLALSGVAPMALGDAMDCHVDASCVAGKTWARNKRSTVRILTGRGFCSGSLVNNTKGDGKMYLLTAFHCINKREDERVLLGAQDLNRMIVYWEFEYEECKGAFFKPEKTTVGGKVLSAQHSSDHALLELIESPLMLDEVPFLYYSGWDRERKETAGMTATFHHPRADAKKVTTFERLSFSRKLNDNIAAPIVGASLSQADLITTRYGDGNHGITEKGSSGSGLFNAALHLVGHLSTGSAGQNCSEGGFTNFSPLFVYWAYGAAGARMKDWLDKANSGKTTLHGMDLCEVPSRHFSASANEKLSSLCTPNPVFAATTGYTTNRLQMAFELNESASKMYWKIAKEPKSDDSFSWLVGTDEEGAVGGILMDEHGGDLLPSGVRTQIEIPLGALFKLREAASYWLYYAFEHAESGRNSRTYHQEIELSLVEKIEEPAFTFRFIKPGEIEASLVNTNGEHLRWAIVEAPDCIEEVNAHSITHDPKILKRGAFTLHPNSTHSWMVDNLAFSREYTLYVHIAHAAEDEVVTRGLTTSAPELGVLVMPGPNRVNMLLRSDTQGVLRYEIRERGTDKVHHTANRIAIEKDEVLDVEVCPLKNFVEYTLMVDSFNEENEALQYNLATLHFSTSRAAGNWGVLSSGGSLHQEAIPELSLYPNPVGGDALYVEASSLVSQIRVMDLGGQELMRRSGPVRQIDLSALESGAYWVGAVFKHGGLITRRIIKE